MVAGVATHTGRGIDVNLHGVRHAGQTGPKQHRRTHGMHHSGTSGTYRGTDDGSKGDLHGWRHDTSMAWLLMTAPAPHPPQ